MTFNKQKWDLYAVITCLVINVTLFILVALDKERTIKDRVTYYIIKMGKVLYNNRREKNAYIYNPNNKQYNNNKDVVMCI